MIGIDDNTWLVYEGQSHYGYGVWPTPIILKATFLDTKRDWISIPASSYLREAKHVFREDSFDPVTRIRRGRIYVWQDGDPQPSNWHVQQHPVLFEEVGSRDHQGRFEKSLLSYRPLSGLGRRLVESSQLALGLGTSEALSIWRIISVEKVASEEELVTLRARSNLGVLPDVIEDALPTLGRESIIAAVKRVTDAAYRSDAEAIVDQCRNAAQVVLSYWLVQQKVSADAPKKDLGKIIKAIADMSATERRALVDSANLIRLMHPRGKSSEQNRLGLRPPVEQDADLALNLIGFILRDLGWAR